MPSSTISSGDASTRSSRACGSDSKPTAPVLRLAHGALISTRSLNSARSFRILRDKRITTVLSVCTDFVPAQDPAMHMRHYRVPIEDVADANVLIELPAACEFIRVALREGRNVLVHSVRGQNRASAVVAAYREWLACLAGLLLLTMAGSWSVMQSYDLDATSALARVRNGELIG
jgi:hypothetical protein